MSSEPRLSRFDPPEGDAPAPNGARRRRRKRSPEGPPLLDVSAVDVHYGPVQALRGIDMRVGEGEIIALLGPNGAGKSSTLRVISGMVPPSSGTIEFQGESIGGLPPYKVVHRAVAHVPEGRELFPGLSVEENLRLGYWRSRKDRKGFPEALERVFEVLPRLKERRKQDAGTMSGGEQQMLAVGRSLMTAPKLLLIDEMSLGLAPMIVSTLFDVVERINQEGTSVIVVEQFVHLALRHSHRAYVLAKGEVVLSDRSDELAASEELLASYLGGEVGATQQKDSPKESRGSKPRRDSGRE